MKITRLLSLATLLLTAPLFADGPPFSPSLQFTTGLAGKQNRLTWAADPGSRYRVFSSADLSENGSPGAWRARAVVEAGEWLDPETAASRTFYRVEPPLAEVFSVEPAVLSAAGGMLTVRAQCLPAGSVVVFEVAGLPPVQATLMPAGPGVYIAIVPPGLPPGSVVTGVRVVDGTGATVWVVGQTFEVTEDGFATEAPPVMPPAASLRGIEKRQIKRSTSAVSPAGYLPGEVVVRDCPLSLATPAGPSLELLLTYRSRPATTSGGGIECGGGWSVSYDVRIEPIPLAAGVLAPRVAVHTGDGRVEMMHRTASGDYVADGLFRTGRFAPDTSFTLTFADQSRWIFCPLVSAPWQGRIGSMVDRNGVALTCTYTPGGQLAQVASQFGQSFTFSYGPGGALSSAADQTGRMVSLAYFGAGEPGGDPGALKSISCPFTPGQMPVQGPVTFTYSTGSLDPRLNDNLLTATDGAGRLCAAFTYSSTANPADAAWDRCVTCDFHRLSPAEPVMHFSYELQPPMPPGTGGLLSISCDETGRVCETLTDRAHRMVNEKLFTTRAAPGIPVTPSANRPPAPAPGEPAYLETSCAWNPDHLCTRCTEPDGMETHTTYACDLDPNCPRRERGNARVHRLECTDESQPPRVVACDYAVGFGTVEGADTGAGDQPVFQSNPIPGIGIVIKRNPRAVSARPGAPISGLSIKGGRSPGGNLVASRVAMLSEDNDCDAVSFVTRMTTAHGQVFTATYDERGNCTATTTPIAGSGTAFTYNSLGQVTSRSVLNGPGSTFRDVVVYDPLTHFCTSVGEDAAEGGGGLQLTTAFCRDALKRIISITDPRGNESFISYNACDQPVSFASPPLGTSPATAERVVCTQEYDAGGLPFRCDLDHRDATGALVAANPHYTGFRVYDARGQLIQEATEQHPVTVPPGATAPDALNLGSFEVCDYTLNSAGECVRVSVPAECRGQATDAVCDFAFDAIGRPESMVTGGAGTPGAVTTEYRYNAASQLTRARTLAPPGEVSPECTFTHDVWRREVSSFDEMGNETRCTYNEITGVVTTTRYGEEIDVPGGFGNIEMGKKHTKTGHVTLLKRELPPIVFDTSGFDGVLYGVGGDDGGPTIPLGMAINEKGLPGEKKPNKTTTNNPKREVGGGSGPDTTGFDGISAAVGGGGGENGDPIIPLGVAINEKGLPGEKKPNKTTTNNPKREIGGGGGPNTGGWGPELGMRTNNPIVTKDVDNITAVVPLPNGVAIKTKGTGAEANRSASPFFAVITRDDVFSVERRTPGAPGPHPLETTIIQRSPAGLVQSITNNGDLLLSIARDTAGRPSACTDGACTLSVVRDACDNVTLCTVTAHSTLAGVPAETFTRNAVYNAAGRMVSSTDGIGNTQTRAFDSMGRCTGATLPGGLVVQCAYDSFASGAFASVAVTCDYNGDSLPDPVSSCVVLCGDCVSSTDAAGYTTSHACDSQGRLTRSDCPDGTYESWSYGALGRADDHRIKNGAHFTAQHNLAGAVTSVSVSSLPQDVVPVPATEYLYNGLGQCVQMTQGTSTIVTVHDSLGNQLSESQNGYTVSHTWTHRGRAGTTAPNGDRYAETRDAWGRVVTFSRLSAGGAVLTPPISQCDYLGRAQVKEVRANGVVTTCDIRSDGESPLFVADLSFGRCVQCLVTAPGGAVLEDCTTRRNADQCGTAELRGFGSAANRPFRLKNILRDLRNLVINCNTRVRAVAGGPMTVESDVTYLHEVRGLRLSATGGNNPGPYASSDLFPPGDAHMGQYSTWPGGPLLWSDNGNLTHLQRGGDSMDLVYDACDRLVGGSDPLTGIGFITYERDAKGRIVACRTSSGVGFPPQVVRFIYDGEVCIEERDDLGVLLRSYAVAGGEGLCFDDDSGPTRYIHSGSSARVVISSTGAPVEYLAEDDASQPIFLNAAGAVRPGATAALTGLTWLHAGIHWSASCQLHLSPAGAYSPELGQAISAPVSGKKVFRGHVTLLK